jgi:hypothetical protein
MKRRPSKIHPDVRDVYLYNGSRLPREPPKEVPLVAYPEHTPLNKSGMSAHSATIIIVVFGILCALAIIAGMGKT